MARLRLLKFSFSLDLSWINIDIWCKSDLCLYCYSPDVCVYSDMIFAWLDFSEVIVLRRSIPVIHTVWVSVIYVHFFFFIHYACCASPAWFLSSNFISFLSKSYLAIQLLFELFFITSCSWGIFWLVLKFS